jgi:hypothetical protein
MTAEERIDEIAAWIWDDFHCSAQHKIDPKLPVKCPNHACGLPIGIRMSRLSVGSKVSCTFCNHSLVLTKEQVREAKLTFSRGA